MHASKNALAGRCAANSKETEEKMDLASYANIPHGDMPGDKIAIDEGHVQKAELLFPLVREAVEGVFAERGVRKAVVAVSGGSGVGKSEVASVLSFLLSEAGIRTYTLSGDNYPHRIPAENDAERQRVYDEHGEAGLRAYLGTQNEIDFALLNHIISDFRAGKSPIALKRMGRTPDELWYDDVDMEDVAVLVIEWTHGLNDNLQGVDVTVLLNSTPEETLAHRRARNRDGNVDSPFTMMVLGIEQDLLKSQAHKANFIVSKQGELLSFEDYENLMGGDAR